MTFIGLMILGSGVFLVAVGSVPEVSRRMRSMFHGWMMACLGAVIIALGAVPLFQGMPVLNPRPEECFRLVRRPNVLGLCHHTDRGGNFRPI